MTESLAKACGQTPVDLCDLKDELMFRKLVRYLERSSFTYPALSEKYQSLLKGPATKENLKSLAALRAEASPCVTVSHSLWSLMFKQGATKNPRKASVQNLIRKKLLAADLYSFTSDSLRERVMLIQEAIDYHLVTLKATQQPKWADLVKNLKHNKSEQENSSGSSEKLTPEPVPGETNPQRELVRLKELYSKIRSGHQQINQLFR